MESGKNVVTAVDRCIDILEYIADQNSSVSVKEIASNLDIPIASCFRIIKNLVDRGYLEKSDTSAEQYEIGMKIMALAEKKSRTLDLRTIALPFMKNLANMTNQTVQLGLLENSGVIYIEQALPRTPVDVLGALFTPLNINVSASGKVLCAFLPVYEQAMYVEKSQFTKMTDNSQMDKIEYKKNLLQIKKQRYATDIEEYSIGVGCLAVPIFDYTEQCIASIGLTGNVGDYADGVSRSKLLENLFEAARKISEKMGSKIELLRRSEENGGSLCKSN